VAVEVGKQRCVGVTEALGSNLGRNPVREHERRAGVAESMGGQ
jgi:hypothetical protein